MGYVLLKGWQKYPLFSMSIIDIIWGGRNIQYFYKNIWEISAIRLNPQNKIFVNNKWDIF
jgi:hypothetical protein